MMRRKMFPMLIITLLVLAIPLLAADRPDPAEQQPEPGVQDAPEQPSSLLNLPPEKVARLAPLPARLRQILLDERERLAPLQAAFAEETDALRGFEIQRQMRDVKIATEVALMRAQADHARANGRPEVAERIEQGLQRMRERDEARQEAARNRSARPQRPSAGR